MSLPLNDAVIERTVDRMVERHGEAYRERALEGARCAAAFWREEDGSSEDFTAFSVMHFAADDETRAALFARLETVFEELYGSALAVSRVFQSGVHVDTGPLLGVDAILAEWSPDAHLADDFYANKLAFVLHLNFPYRSLERKAAEGARWSRREWAEARLGDLFITRAPAAASQRLASALSAAETYVAGRYLYPSCLRDGDSGPLFPEGKRLLMHWNLRDEIRALYAEPDGFRRQRLLFAAMEGVVAGRVPRAFYDSRALLWDPVGGSVASAEGAALGGAPDASFQAEGDERYERLLAIFRAEREYDLWCPDNPSLVARKFNMERELPERVVGRLFREVLSSPELGRAARALSRRLGRALEPFDLWYQAWDAGAPKSESALDTITRERYPNARAFKSDIPRILRSLGFPAAEADWLAERIEVDPSRGSGHAMPAAKRSDSVRLRTRVPPEGMDYKGYNIACHELGHNVEQVFSLHGIDEYFLAGVPNNAFTEAFAFVFQARDLELLGIEGAPRGPSVLSDFWITCEMAGVGLVDMELWRWMYAHPDCDARSLREAALDIARSVWNDYFAEAFGHRDALVLGSYAHMIELAMYLPDYALGHLIAFQIEAAMAGGPVGASMGRLCRLGRLCPDRWMIEATGSPVSSAPLLAAARAALDGRA